MIVELSLAAVDHQEGGGAEVDKPIAAVELEKEDEGE